jgi:hypothetical protein
VRGGALPEELDYFHSSCIVNICETLRTFILLTSSTECQRCQGSGILPQWLHCPQSMGSLKEVVYFFHGWARLLTQQTLFTIHLPTKESVFREFHFPYIQGGALNRGLIRFFSLYRPSCHVEAYIRPEKYCFLWAGPLASHHSILTSFFLATAQRRRRKERYVLRIYTAASRSYSAATDGRRAAKLA